MVRMFVTRFMGKVLAWALFSSNFFMSSNNIDGIILLGKIPPALIDWQYMLPYVYYSETVKSELTFHLQLYG